jgi:hypothetical protein
MSSNNFSGWREWCGSRTLLVENYSLRISIRANSKPSRILKENVSFGWLAQYDPGTVSFLVLSENTLPPMKVWHRPSILDRFEWKLNKERTVVTVVREGDMIISTCLLAQLKSRDNLIAVRFDSVYAKPTHFWLDLKQELIYEDGGEPSNSIGLVKVAVV